MRRGVELVGDACLASGKNSPAAAYVEFTGNVRHIPGHGQLCTDVYGCFCAAGGEMT